MFLQLKLTMDVGHLKHVFQNCLYLFEEIILHRMSTLPVHVRVNMLVIIVEHSKMSILLNKEMFFRLSLSR